VFLNPARISVSLPRSIVDFKKLAFLIHPQTTACIQI
jgi:hypothetical protein